MAILNPEPSSVCSPIVRRSLVGLFGEDPVGRMEEVGVGALATPPHPAADLVQLPQAQQVGAVDDQGVDRGHVDAGLDDGRAHEDVVALLPEVEHHRLEAPLVHLPVGDGHPRLGHQVAQVARHAVDVRHPVVHVEHLALAQELAAEGLADRGGVVLADVGEDRATVGRRRVDHATGPGCP